VLDLQRGQVTFSKDDATLGVIEGISGDDLRFFCYFNGLDTSCTIVGEQAISENSCSPAHPSRSLTTHGGIAPKDITPITSPSLALTDLVPHGEGELVKRRAPARDSAPHVPLAQSPLEADSGTANSSVLTPAGRTVSSLISRFQQTPTSSPLAQPEDVSCSSVRAQDSAIAGPSGIQCTRTHANHGRARSSPGMHDASPHYNVSSMSQRTPPLHYTPQRQPLPQHAINGGRAASASSPFSAYPFELEGDTNTHSNSRSHTAAAHSSRARKTPSSSLSCTPPPRAAPQRPSCGSPNVLVGGVGGRGAGSSEGSAQGWTVVNDDSGNGGRNSQKSARPQKRHVKWVFD
jgi:hypothetical protein